MVGFIEFNVNLMYNHIMKYNNDNKMLSTLHLIMLQIRDAISTIGQPKPWHLFNYDQTIEEVTSHVQEAVEDFGLNCDNRIGLLKSQHTWTLNHKNQEEPQQNWQEMSAQSNHTR